MKILLGISGASGVNLGFELIKALEDKCELYIILTHSAKLSFMAENEHLKLDEKSFLSYIQDDLKLKGVFFDDRDLAASVASGSFGIQKTIIAPCSINTLAKIYHGFSDTLLTRACAVALKEQKKLILAVREMPFSTLNLKHMYKLSKMGVCIAPPVYANYAKLKSVEEFNAFFVGKWLDLLDIRHNLYKKWHNFQKGRL